MIRNVIIVAAVLGIAAMPAYADGASKEEAAGVGFGAVVGGFAGGPVGAILGAAIGAGIGDKFHQKTESVDRLSAELDATQGKMKRLETSIAMLQTEAAAHEIQMKAAREMTPPELERLLKAGIEMDLLFRTDEHSLSPEAGRRLGELATSLTVNPDIRIRIDGFADERGDESYNRKLSGMRADHVRDLLVSNGVANSRITVTAHGETESAEKTADSFALERRVSLTLYLDGPETVASNPATN